MWANWEGYFLFFKKGMVVPNGQKQQRILFKNSRGLSRN